MEITINIVTHLYAFGMGALTVIVGIGIFLYKVGKKSK